MLKRYWAHHLNPHLFGANGSYRLSGSGTTYILAYERWDNRDLLRKVLNLSVALFTTSSEMERGEGHYIAAGPTIPTSAKEEFIQKLDAVIDRQIGSMNISDSQKKKKKKKKNA